jgi:hypothetical protein
MHPVRLIQLGVGQHTELDHANRAAKDGGSGLAH